MQMLRWPNIYKWRCWRSQRKLDYFPSSTGNYWQCRTKNLYRSVSNGDMKADKPGAQLPAVSSICCAFKSFKTVRHSKCCRSNCITFIVWRLPTWTAVSVRYFTCEMSVKETLTWWNSQHHVSCVNNTPPLTPCRRHAGGLQWAPGTLAYTSHNALK